MFRWENSLEMNSLQDHKSLSILVAFANKQKILCVYFSTPGYAYQKKTYLKKMNSSQNIVTMEFL